jgi:hypothetical protein
MSETESEPVLALALARSSVIRLDYQWAMPSEHGLALLLEIELERESALALKRLLEVGLDTIHKSLVATVLL